MAGFWGSGYIAAGNQGGTPAIGKYIRLPDGPEDESQIEFGSIWVDLVTGRIKIRDAGGVREL